MYSTSVHGYYIVLVYIDMCQLVLHVLYMYMSSGYYIVLVHFNASILYSPNNYDKQKLKVS